MMITRSEPLEILKTVGHQGLLPKEAWHLCKYMLEEVHPPTAVMIDKRTPILIIDALMRRMSVEHIRFSGIVYTCSDPIQTSSAKWLTLENGFAGNIGKPPQLYGIKILRENPAWPCISSALSSMPASLRHVEITGSMCSWCTEQAVPIPDSVETLVLTRVRHGVILPAALKVLTLDNCVMSHYKELPPDLSELHILGDPEQFQSYIDSGITSTDTTVSTIPTVLPEKLKILHISKYIICRAMLFLPSSLLTLDLSGAFYNLELALPPALQILRLPELYEHALCALPDSLRVLQFCKSTVYKLPLGTLPLNLEELYLPSTFDMELGPLPARLQVLHVGEKYSRCLGDLPKGLCVAYQN